MCISLTGKFSKWKKKLYFNLKLRLTYTNLITDYQKLQTDPKKVIRGETSETSLQNRIFIYTPQSPPLTLTPFCEHLNVDHNGLHSCSEIALSHGIKW